MLIILMVLFALGGWWLWREWRVDSCNDGPGGWNHSSGECEPLPG